MILPERFACDRCGLVSDTRDKDGVQCFRVSLGVSCDGANFWSALRDFRGAPFSSTGRMTFCRECIDALSDHLALWLPNLKKEQP